MSASDIETTAKIIEEQGLPDIFVRYKVKPNSVFSEEEITSKNYILFKGFYGYRVWKNSFSIFNCSIYVKELLYKELFSKILDKYGVDNCEKEYIFSYFSLGLVAIIQKWIEKDCVDDIKTIANIMKKVIKHEN